MTERRVQPEASYNSAAQFGWNQGAFDKSLQQAMAMPTAHYQVHGYMSNDPGNQQKDNDFEEMVKLCDQWNMPYPEPLQRWIANGKKSEPNLHSVRDAAEEGSNELGQLIYTIDLSKIPNGITHLIFQPQN